MTFQENLKKATKQLEEAGIGTARLDALVLLEDILNTERAQLLARPDVVLSHEQEKRLDTLVTRRSKHEPLAYIRGKVEFYGREFVVNKNVLVPRPESETMLELFKELAMPGAAVVADVGSGSGALGITAALERPTIHVHFIDIDRATLEVAKKNAALHAVAGEFHEGDLLNAHEAQYDVLLCNLPYVPSGHTINAAAMTEPSIAIFGGEDGLDLYRRLFEQLSTNLYGRPIVLTESLPFQHEELARIASSSGYHQAQRDDFIQVFRH